MSLSNVNDAALLHQMPLIEKPLDSVPGMRNKTERKQGLARYNVETIQAQTDSLRPNRQLKRKPIE